MSDEKTQVRWYLLSTKHGKETLALKELQHICAEVFLPFLRQSDVAVRPQPVFPGRIFARVDLTSRRFEVKYAPGMRDLLKPPPVEVPDSLMTELKAAAKHPSAGEVASVSGAVRRLFDPAITSLERTVMLVRLIEERSGL